MAPDVRFQLMPWLYSLDQLPHDFAELRKLVPQPQQLGHHRGSRHASRRTVPFGTQTRYTIAIQQEWPSCAYH